MAAQGKEMTLITITCPHCRYSKQIKRSIISPAQQRVTCPACRQKFILDNAALSSPSIDPSEGTNRHTCPECGFPSKAATCPQCRHTPPLPLPEGPTPQIPDSGADIDPRMLSFTFTGKASEYFGIWVVNNLLRIITLGFYSPWAKVRKRQYFYGNTLLDGTPFDYLADPLALFRGWLIAMAAFILYSLVSNVSQTLGSLLGIALFLAVPWAIVRSRLFNLRSSAHRNVRFDFNPDYQEAYIVFTVLPFLTPFTLGLLFPYTLYRQKRFMMENSRFGTSDFTFEATSNHFYKIFFTAFGWIIFLIVVTIGGFSLLDEDTRNLFGTALAVIIPLAFFLVYFLIGLHLYTATTNLAWNTTSIAGNRFRSTLRTRDLAWIYASNAVAAFLSLGLLIPWCAVRLAHYRCSKLAFEAYGNLDTFVALQPEEVSASGEEIGDIFGLEIGL